MEEAEYIVITYITKRKYIAVTYNLYNTLYTMRAWPHAHFNKINLFEIMLLAMLRGFKKN